VALPNLYWNWLNGWPSLAFYRSRPAVDVSASVGEALLLLIVGTNPATVLVWLAGLLFLLLSREARSHRALGVAFVVLLAVILFSGLRRVDRMAGIFPIVLAAGATFWDRWRGRGRGFVRFGLPALVLGFGALLLPASLPIVPPEAAARYFAALGDAPDIETADVGVELPLYLVGRLEWERLADQVAATFESLPREERERAVILAPHWVFASVVEYYGRDRDLPPIVSPHNAYWFWREEAAGRDVVLSVGVEAEVLSRSFATTRELGVFHCEHCAVFRPDLPILVSTGPIRPIEELLSGWRHFSIEAAPALRR
jgi:hypothetical protein